MLNKVDLTNPEQMFYDLLIDYEILSMVKEVKTQMWTKVLSGYRRIDFVLIIDDDMNNRKGLFIEIDDPGHEEHERKQDDLLKEEQIFNVSFPLLRFTYYEIFNATERVMNEIESKIDLMKEA